MCWIKFLVLKRSVCMSWASVFEWYKLFKEGREPVDDDSRPGLSSTSTDDQLVYKIKELLFENWRLTVRHLTAIVGISDGPMKTISTDNLGLRKVKARLVPKYCIHSSWVFTKHSTDIFPQPPYSPDLGPCDFRLLNKLERPLRGNRFESTEYIKSESLPALKAISEIDFSNYSEDWKQRWRKCIVAGGDNVEGYDIYLEE